MNEMLNGMYSKMNTSADACTNFYEYACGGWESKEEIPDDRSSWSSFGILSKSNKDVIEKLLASSKEGKANEYYHSCMDQNAINGRGVQPLLSLRDSLNLKFKPGSGCMTSDDYNTLAVDLAKLYKGAGVEGFFCFGVGADAKNSSSNIVGASQCGLSLDERDYYVDKDPHTDKTLLALREYIHSTFTKVEGKEPDATLADGIIDFETSLATIMMDKISLRDPQKTYNKMDSSQLEAKMPKFPLSLFLNKLYDGKPVNKVDVSTPEYFDKLSTLLEKTPKTTVYNFLSWKLFSAHMSHLDAASFAISFKFSQALSGVEKAPRREEICVGRTEGALPDHISRMFVDHKFSEGSKKFAEKMIENIRKAFIKNLDTITWMDKETKLAAKNKALKIKDKIAYPAKIHDDNFLTTHYQTIETDPEKYFENHMSAVKFSVKEECDKLGKPVDKEEWGMTSSTVNAYYDPSKNEIVFPAGILQLPFFQSDYHKAFNYGGIGVVMGHELTHGFDDQGAKYDETGNLKSWWKNSTMQRFEEKTSCLVNQYSEFTIAYNKGQEHVNGKLTLGENIADNGGFHLSYNAYKNDEGSNPDEKLSYSGQGFTAKQIFFLSFAQVWCAKSREAALHRQVMGDPHSPAFARVNGAVANSEIFDEAFDCQRQSNRKRCHVW
uniref:Endothelin-converting enzyme 1 n=1 Tax=Amorphochlora amoebiformis TaxID=1561963 RepID=A0A6T6V272_9EUKA